MRNNDYVQMCSQQKTCRFKLTKLKSIDHTQSEQIRMKWNKLYEKAESISLKITKVIKPVVTSAS
jgi:hypothetical protein